MKDSEIDDYIKPPSYSYVDSVNNLKYEKEDSLIVKLKLKIGQDMHQINGVYDMQIEESKNAKNKLVSKLEADHIIVVTNINKQREKDLERYRKKAELCVDNLITSPEITIKPKEYSWIEWFRIKTS